MAQYVAQWQSVCSAELDQSQKANKKAKGIPNEPFINNIIGRGGIRGMMLEIEDSIVDKYI